MDMCVKAKAKSVQKRDRSLPFVYQIVITINSTTGFEPSIHSSAFSL